jgi:hypothetical protein
MDKVAVLLGYGVQHHYENCQIDNINNSFTNKPQTLFNFAGMQKDDGSRVRFK